MDSKILKRTLQSVGMKCFIQNFDVFSSPKFSHADMVEILENENDFTLKSCKSRANHAIRIFRENSELEALEMIIGSPRVDSITKVEAEKIHTRRTMPPIKFHQIELIQKLKKFKAKDPSCTKVYCTTCGGLSHEIEKSLTPTLIAEICDFIASKTNKEIYQLLEWGELLNNIYKKQKS